MIASGIILSALIKDISQITLQAKITRRSVNGNS